MTSETSNKRFRIAFSFAGEKRKFVEATAQILAERLGEDKILYDKFHEAEFAYANLAFDLPSLYKKETDLIVTVLCHDYKQKEWCGLEWRAIFSMIKSNHSKKVLLSRFDLVEDEDLNGLAGFIDLDKKTPEQFAALILQRLAINEGKSKDLYTKDDYNQEDPVKPTANPLDKHHKSLAVKLLKDAPLFFQALQDDFTNEYPTQHVPASADKMVDYFSNCAPKQVQELFYMVRRALKALEEDELDVSITKQTSEAASAMYCLAAIRMVNRAAHEQGNLTLKVPRSENVICAIIATALFGGTLRLQPTEQNQLPNLEYVFEILVPANGDHLQLGFDRAIYTALFENSQQVCLGALDTQPLTVDEDKALAARLRTIKNVKRECLALIVNGYANQDSARPFADKHQIPVMFPSSEAATIILGMDVGDLLQEISEFWQELNHFHQSNSNSKETSGTENMQNSGFNINAPGANIAINTGANSSAQAGNNNTANTGQQQSVDLAPLISLLNELHEAIAELTSIKAKETLYGHLQTAQSELSNNDKPDFGIIKQSLETINQVGGVIDSGEKIVGLCSQALPFLSLLPSAF